MSGDIVASSVNVKRSVRRMKEVTKPMLLCSLAIAVLCVMLGAVVCEQYRESLSEHVVDLQKRCKEMKNDVLQLRSEVKAARVEKRELASELFRILLEAPSEKFETRDLRGDWKLIVSKDAAAFLKRNPKTSLKLEDLHRNGWFRMRIDADNDYHLQWYTTYLSGKEDVTDANQYYRDGTKSVWIDKCLVFNGDAASTLELCLKHGRLQIKERRLGVTWYRIYQKLSNQ